MITIWGRANSINVQKVLWALEELGLSHDRIDAGLQYGVNDTPAFKAMNPNGLVPVLKDDDFVLWESHAILRYLAARYGREGLWPKSHQVAARADQWMDWSHSVVWSQLRPVFHHLVRTPVEQRDLSVVAAGTTGLAQSFLLLDQQLQKHPFVAGDVFSIGDIPLALMVYRWSSLVPARPVMLALDQWFERVSNREGYLKHCSAPLT